MRRKSHGGITGVTIPISVQDTTSATGAGLGSLVFNSAGLIGEYRRQGEASWTAFTLVAGTLGTWSSGGWVADGAATGDYEVGPPDAAVASGARWVVLRYRGAANMLPVRIEIELDAVDYQDNVRFGLSALPNAAANANGGLPILSVGGTTLGYTVSTLTTYTGNTPQTGDSYARIGATGSGLTSLAPSATALSTAQWTNTRAGLVDNLDAAVTSRLAPTVAGRTLDVSATGEAGIDWANVGSPTSTVGLTGTTVGTLTTYTGNTPQTGDAYARLGAPAGSSIAADLVTIAGYVDTVESRLPAALVGGRMDSSVGAMATDVLSAASVSAGAVTKIQAGLSTYAGTDTAGTTTLLARLGTPTGASIAADLVTIAAYVDTVESRLPAALVGGRMDSSVGAMATDALSAASVSAAAVTKIQAGLSTYAGTDTAGTTTLLARLTDGRATNLDNLDVASSTLSTYAGTDTPGTTTLLSRITTAPPSAATIVDQMWDEAMSGHVIAGSAGAALAAAGTAGDPWIATLPGSYAPGTAGFIVGSGGSGALPADGLDAVMVEAGVSLPHAIAYIGAMLAGIGGAKTGGYRGMGVADMRVNYTAVEGERTGVVLHPPT